MQSQTTVKDQNESYYKGAARAGKLHNPEKTSQADEVGEKASENALGKTAELKKSSGPIKKVSDTKYYEPEARQVKTTTSWVGRPSKK